MIRGCDLSAVQGVLSDAVWKALADQGIVFVFLRTVVGNETWVDGAAAENAKRARAHGIMVAPYVFAYPLPHIDPVKAAEYFVSKLQGMGMQPGELPPMLDLEWPPREEHKVIDGVKTLTYPWTKWGCSAPQIRGWAERCLDRCEELTGLEWLVYLFRYFGTCIEVEKSPALGRRGLVLADYTYSGRWPTDAELAKLKVPAPWDKILFVQHDGDGGLKLPTGMDADFDCFLGSPDELHALAAARGSELEVVTPEPIIDATAVRQRELGYMLDDMIEDYRRRRIDEAA